MALIVEDGTGLPDADSYASVDDADEYHIAMGRTDAEWLDLEVEAKESRLRAATAYLVRHYRLRWAGYRKTVEQKLDWPRYEVPRRDAPYAVDSWYGTDSVPSEVREACFELALRATTPGALDPDLAPPVRSKTVGPISVTYAETARKTTAYVTVEGLLEPLLRLGGSSIPVARA